MEQLILLAEILSRIIFEKARRIGLFLRTSAASFLPPLAAFRHAVIAAVPCISPAVRQRPDNRLISFCQILKEHRNIYVISVQIMKMNDIRIIIFYLLNEFCRGAF